MTLPGRLQELRKSYHMSQEQLAEKLDVSRQAISKWESGQANPDINNIMKLSNIYGVSTDYILTGKEPEKQIIYKEQLSCQNKKGLEKLHDLPSSIRIALAILIIAFGVFVMVPILFVVAMELLSLVF